MASKLEILREVAEKRGDSIGHLLPANWIELNGRFTVGELRTVINTISANFKKSNGSTK